MVCVYTDATTHRWSEDTEDASDVRPPILLETRPLVHCCLAADSRPAGLSASMASLSLLPFSPQRWWVIGAALCMLSSCSTLFLLISAEKISKEKQDQFKGLCRVLP